VIVTRTPLRISLAGGGSDLSSFYEFEGGAVVSLAINKSVYIACHKLYSGGISLSYSRREEVTSPSEIKHPLIRESLSALGFMGDIEIGSFADIPASGTGLGSSSAFTVGLLKAISSYMGKSLSAQELAEMACEVEIKRCGEPIGKQDQFAAAFGGVNLMHFHSSGKVEVESLYSSSVSSFLESTLLLFDLEFGRKASEILAKQSDAMKERETFERVIAIRNLVKPMVDALVNLDYPELGRIVHESWLQKKELAPGISNIWIEEIHEHALKSGALAAKVVGAGGGGFLLVVVKPGQKSDFRRRFKLTRELMFRVNQNGSEVVFCDEDSTDQSWDNFRESSRDKAQR
jgi:D-glycero-alpha-D-manno-heptose-7-phosphate kinase